MTMITERYVRYLANNFAWPESAESKISKNENSEVNEAERDCPVCWETLKDPVYHENLAARDKSHEKEKQSKHLICLACAKKIAKIQVMRNQSFSCPICRVLIDHNSVFTWQDKCFIEVLTIKQNAAYGAVNGASLVSGLITGTLTGVLIGGLTGTKIGQYVGMLLGCASGISLGSFLPVLAINTNKLNLGAVVASCLGAGLGMSHGLAKTLFLNGVERDSFEPRIVILAAIAFGIGGGALGAGLGGFFQRKIMQLYTKTET